MFSEHRSTMTLTTVIMLAFVALNCRPTISVKCLRGSYVYTPREGRDVCFPCAEGINFMPETDHTNRECYPCSQVLDDSVEILISPCNRTNDAEILCQDGYYRRKARSISEKDTCTMCSQCENPVRACQGYHDTVCCDSPDNAAVLDKFGVFRCTQRPVPCGKGQHLNTDSGECSPCPENTYMNVDSHINTQCFNCAMLSSNLGLHSAIIQKCGNTSQTLFGCKGGYFRDPGQESLAVEVSCSPCQVCHHVGRDCDMFHDTVCCQEPGMMVTDTEYGPECRAHLRDTTPNQTVQTIDELNKQLVMGACKTCLQENHSDKISNVIGCIDVGIIFLILVLLIIITFKGKSLDLVDSIRVRRIHTTARILSSVFICLHLVIYIYLRILYILIYFDAVQEVKYLTLFSGKLLIATSIFDLIVLFVDCIFYVKMCSSTRKRKPSGDSTRSTESDYVLFNFGTMTTSRNRST